MELTPLYAYKGFKLSLPYEKVKLEDLQLIDTPILDADRQEVLIDIVKNEQLCIALIDKQNKELNKRL